MSAFSGPLLKQGAQIKAAIGAFEFEGAPELLRQDAARPV